MVPSYTPSAPRRAVRLVAFGVFALAALAGLGYAASTFIFGATWQEDEDEFIVEGEQAALGDGRSVRHFFEVEDDGARTLTADLDLALGRVTASRAEEGALFQAEVDLMSDQLRPRFVKSSDGGGAHVALGLADASVSFRGVRATRGNAWRLYFSDRAPLRLNLSLGAAEADLDLTGVPVERLVVECGMAQARIRFTEPNPVVLERLSLESGLSDFRAIGLGFARFQQLDFDGGAGEFTLDFTGDAFVPGARADVSVGMAKLTLVLPRDLPVVLDAPSSFMTHVEVPAALGRLGKGRWASDGADADLDAFRIDVSAGPGSVRVRFAD